MSVPSFDLTGPANPLRPDTTLEPFVAELPASRILPLRDDCPNEIVLAATDAVLHPDLPAVPVWGFGPRGYVTSPGPLLEASAGVAVDVLWRNDLPGSVHPQDPKPPIVDLPFATAVTPDPDAEHPVQNALGAGGGTPEDTGTAPIGWASVHLHGGHSRADADGWPDNMCESGGQQESVYDNTYDNSDIDLRKIGAHLWYHDHAMGGTRYHVFAGLAGGYLVRDPREAELGLPTGPEDGEIHLLLQDRNVTPDGAGGLRLLHKTTPDTAEFFGPLTLVDGALWPRVALRPAVFRLRLLNGSNARAYRLHLIRVGPGKTITVEHDRLRIVGGDGGLLWRTVRPTAADALTLAPAERLDVLVDLSGLEDGTQLYLINSAPAPFGGGDPPPLEALLDGGDPGGLNPYPWVARLDVDASGRPGRDHALIADLDARDLSPGFRRLVHDLSGGPAEPAEVSVEGHEHHVILLGETDPPGHLYLQEVVEDPFGSIALQLPGDPLPRTYRAENWMVDDHTPSTARVSFYDRVALRPTLGRWQVWRFVNTTGDTHPIHIHQSQFQPLGGHAALLRYETVDGGPNRYDPVFRRTLMPLELDPAAGRTYEPHEVHGWKDVIRVDPGNVVSVAVRFDVPGRYVYHCHVLEHEDTEMMRPFLVSVLPMGDGPGMAHMM